MAPTLREILDDALRFWERGRILYNLLLTAVVVCWYLVGWPQLAAETIPGIVTALFLFAVVANIFYCAAYLADVPVQYSSYRQVWQRWRWLLWLTGTLFAAVFATLGSYILFFDPPLV